MVQPVVLFAPMGTKVAHQQPVNILSTQITHDDWIRIFTTHPPRAVLPPWGGAEWEAVFSRPLVQQLVAAPLQRAAEEALRELPALKDALYAQYATSGERLPFEKVYLERRRQLARAAIALLVRGSAASKVQRLSFVKKLESIFNEKSWAFPAHVSAPSGQDPNVIDLFCAETANLMGESLAVFSTIIPAALRTKILDRLRRQVFERYCENDFFWIHSTNNWNAVCHQGVLGAALTIEEDSTLLADMFTKATLHLPQFLRGFSADGGCSEGVQYWEYGFGHFAMLNQQLEFRTAGELSLFNADSKVHAIAGYGCAMSFADGTPVNFSDCKPDARLWAFLPRYLADTLEHEGCDQLADLEYRRLWEIPICLDSQRADLFHWLRLYLFAPDWMPDTGQADAIATTLDDARQDVAIASLGVWVVSGVDREGHLWEVAAKGGHNGEHHNHNDIGNFILKVDGFSFISELGMPEYCRDYFTPEHRYTFLAARSLGHSLPVINGQEQAEGAEYFGVVLHQDLEQDEVYYEIDITQSYPVSAECRRYIRRLCLSKSNGSLRCVDHIELHNPGMVEAAFISECEEVSILSSQVAQLSRQGLTLQASCSGSLGWNRIEIHAYKDHYGALRKCQRLVLACNDVASTFTIIVNFRLVTEA